MCKVISHDSIRKANERAMSRRRSKVSMDNKTAQMSHSIWDSDHHSIPGVHIQSGPRQQTMKNLIYSKLVEDDADIRRRYNRNGRLRYLQASQD